MAAIVGVLRATGHDSFPAGRSPKRGHGYGDDPVWGHSLGGRAGTSSAPSAGPPPWHLYRVTPTKATALQVDDPGGATSWSFDE